MQHFDFTLPVNGAREIHVYGSYVYYLAGSAGGADDTILLKTMDGSDEVILRPGQSFDLGQGEKHVRWNIHNYKNQGTIVGRLLMGSGTFSDNRISGSVEVIDAGYNISISGTSFFQSVSVGALAANYSTAQIFNPVGSGKLVVIRKVNIATDVTGTAGLSFHAENVITAGSRNAAAKKSGAGASAAVMGYTQTPGVIGAGFLNRFVTANQPQDIGFSEPLILTPGWGLHAAPGAVNVSMSLAVDFIEREI